MSNTAVAQRISFSAMISTDKYQRAINNTLRDPARARRFVAAITSAVAINPALQECDPSTVLSGALLGESLNLSPSPQLGQYYLVPYENRKKGCKDAQFQIGYKGYVQLAERSGQYLDIDAFSVREGEYKGRDRLTRRPIFEFYEDDVEREARPVVGYCAWFELLNGFKKIIYWSKDKMLAHADRYSPAFSIHSATVKTKNGPMTKVSFADYEAHNYPQKDEWLYSSFWYKNFDGMAHKTMLRQLISKWGIMSVEMQQAMDSDGAVVTEDGEYIHMDEAALPTPAEPEPAIEAPEAPAPEEEQVNLSDV